jgi:hypothetical protein
MIYTCAVCNRHLATDDRFLTAGTAYVAVLTCDTGERFYCCADCAEQHSGPGKYQGNYGRNDIGKCLILDAWAGTSSEDDFMNSDGWGYAGLFGTLLLLQDEQGFSTFEEFTTTDKAQARFDELYAHGMGYQEDDVVIGEDGKVWFGREQLNVERDWNKDHAPVTDTRRYAAINLAMHRQGFFPNVWRETRYGIELDRSFRGRDFTTVKR